MRRWIFLWVIVDWRDRWVWVAWLIKKFQYTVSPIGALTLSYLFGTESNHVPIVAGTFIALDVLTGTLKGYVLRVLSPDISRRGLAVKVALVSTIAFGHAIDLVLGSGNLFKSLFAYGVITSEALSIVQNFAAMGIIVPEKVKLLLEALFDVRGKLDVPPEPIDPTDPPETRP